MSVIYMKAVDTTVREIFNETVMVDLFLPYTKGHRTKLTSPLDWQTPICLMSIIHLKAVTTTVQEIFDETVMVDLF